MSILFGNDTAAASVEAGAGGGYAAGSVLALVTWSQKEDGHWFGARIPKDFKTMEVVKVDAGADGKIVDSYEKYDGARAAASNLDDGRSAYIVGLRASTMP